MLSNPHGTLCKAGPQLSGQGSSTKCHRGTFTHFVLAGTPA